MSVRQAAMALRKRESRAIRYHAPSSKLAVVRSISPLTAELIDNAITLDSEDLVLSQWLFAYDEERGIEVGDTLVLLSVGEGHFIATDVVATTLMPPGPRPPNGSAGGVLGGTYPNPSFAVDMATQAELNAATAASVNDGDAAGGDLSGTFPNPAIAAGVIVNADVNAAAAIAYSKLNLANSITAGDIVADAVGASELANDAVVNANIASGAQIEAAKLNWNLGTTPPGSPTDGMLWLYDGSGYHWQLVYDSSEATYKWKSVGGGPLVSQDTGDRTGAFTANVWGQPYTPNPTITLPRAGDYLITAGCTLRPVTGACTAWIGVQIGGTNPTVDGAWTAGGYSPVSAARQNLNLCLLGTGFAAGAVLALVYENTVTQSLARNNAYITATPVRVI